MIPLLLTIHDVIEPFEGERPGSRDNTPIYSVNEKDCRVKVRSHHRETLWERERVRNKGATSVCEMP